MKTLIMCLAGAFFALSSLTAQTAVTTVTTHTGTGTITEYVPNSSFVVKEASGPVTYQYGPQVVYATRSGVVLTPEQVQARIRVGVPVSVEYAPQGDVRFIRRIVVDEDDDDDEGED